MVDNDLPDLWLCSPQKLIGRIVKSRESEIALMHACALYTCV